MNTEELKNTLSSYKGYVSSKTRSAIREILSLSWEYQYLGADFAFDKNKLLFSNVNAILSQMTDALYDYSFTKARETADDDDTDAVLVMLDFDGIKKKYDKHTDNLKKILELYIGIAFANKYTRGELLSKFTSFISSSPSTLHFGRGVMRNPISAYILLGQNTIHTAYQTTVLIGFRKDPTIIGYRVVRGSTYDCDTCDALTYGVHPLSEQCLPAHYRCRCRAVPVHLGEI